MRKSMVSFFKMILLFVIVFKFLCISAESIYAACINVFYDVRVYDLNFYGLQPFYMQVLMLVTALVMVFFAVYQFFKILVRYVLFEDNEMDKTSDEEEKKRYKSRLKNQIMIIILYSMVAMIFSIVVQVFNAFYR